MQIIKYFSLVGRGGAVRPTGDSAEGPAAAQSAGAECAGSQVSEEQNWEPLKTDLEWQNSVPEKIIYYEAFVRIRPKVEIVIDLGSMYKLFKCK